MNNMSKMQQSELIVDGNKNELYIPKELRDLKEAERQEQYKKLQDDILAQQEKLYEERISPDWEIRPTERYVILKPYVDSPYLSPHTASGLILKRDLKYNPRSGENEMQEREIAVGTVVDCGCECKEIKPGMDAMFLAGGAKVLPISTNEFGEEEWVIIPEQHIILYGYKLNKDVDRR